MTSEDERELFLAVENNDEARIAGLLRRGVDVNVRSVDGWTPLLGASRSNVEIVSILLRTGADPNLSSFMGYTPLMRAAGHGCNSIVEVLIGAGADIYARDDRGQSALDMAYAEGFVETATILEQASLERPAGMDDKKRAQAEAKLHSDIEGLLQWITQAAASGLSKDAVTATMVGSGWPEELARWLLKNYPILSIFPDEKAGLAEVNQAQSNEVSAGISDRHPLRRHTVEIVWGTREAEAGKDVRSFQGHGAGVMCVAFTPSGRLVVSGSYDRSLRVWEVASGRQVMSLEGHSDLVSCVAVTADSRYAVSGSFDRTIKVWDLETGRLIRSLEGHSQPVSTIAVTASGSFAVSGSYDRTVRVWALDAGPVGEPILGHTGRIRCLVITPNGNSIVSCSDDGSLRVWDLETGTQVGAPILHGGSVNCVSVASNGRVAISGSDGNTIKMWDLTTGAQILSIHGHVLGENCIATSNDAKTFFTGSIDGTVKEWELGTGREIASFHFPGSVEACSLSPDGKDLAIAVGDRVAILNTENSSRAVFNGTPLPVEARDTPSSSEANRNASKTPALDDEIPVVKAPVDADLQTAASRSEPMSTGSTGIFRRTRVLRLGVPVKGLETRTWIKSVKRRISARLGLPMHILAANSDVGDQMPVDSVDLVHFSVTSPLKVSPGSSFQIDVWAHLDEQRRQVYRRAKREMIGYKVQMKSKGPTELSRGTKLTITLQIPGFYIEMPDDILLWAGQTGNATFVVAVPTDAPLGPRTGTARIRAEGLEIARLSFILNIGRKPMKIGRLPVEEVRHRQAFASYASEDTDAVLRCIQGMLKAAPGMSVFFAEADLHSGESWKERLREEITRRDVMYLFWSEAASKSEWVEWEWRLGLRERGIKFIDPCPLVSPQSVPPPKELADELHFNDWMQAYMRSQR